MHLYIIITYLYNIMKKIIKKSLHLMDVEYQIIFSDVKCVK